MRHPSMMNATQKMLNGYIRPKRANYSGFLDEPAICSDAISRFLPTIVLSAFFNINPRYATIERQGFSRHLILLNGIKDKGGIYKSNMSIFTLS